MRSLGIVTPLEQQLEDERQKFQALSQEEHSAEAKKRIARLGGSYRALGIWREALSAFDMGLSRSQKASDAEGISEFLTLKSNVYYHMGRYGRAIEFASCAIGLEIADSSKVSRISYYLASPYLMLGDVERYVALQEEAKGMTDKLPDGFLRDYELWILCRLARGFDMMGDHQKANSMLLEQVQRFRDIRDGHGMPLGLLMLGVNLLHLRKFEEARQNLSESLQLYEENGQEGFVVDATVGLSEVALCMGELHEAKEYSKAAIEEARKGPRRAEGLADKRHLNQALIQGVKVCLALGKKEKALVLWKEAMDLATESNRKLMIAELLELQGASTEGD